MSRVSDYKYDIEVLADQLAQADGLEYLELLEPQRSEYYARADKQYWESGSRG